MLVYLVFSHAKQDCSCVQREVFAIFDYALFCRLTDGEKEKLLTKRKSEEERYRKSGQLEAMAGLLHKLPQVGVESRSLNDNFLEVYQWLDNTECCNVMP